MAIFVTFCAVSDDKSHRAKGLSQTVTPRLSVCHLNSTTLSEPLQTGLQRRGLQRRRPHCAGRRGQITRSLSAGQRSSAGRRDGGGGEVGERPAESEVAVFVTAPDPLHRAGLSRAGPFNCQLNLKNQAADENDKKGIPVSCHRRGA